MRHVPEASIDRTRTPRGAHSPAFEAGFTFSAALAPCVDFDSNGVACLAVGARKPAAAAVRRAGQRAAAGIAAVVAASPGGARHQRCASTQPGGIRCSRRAPGRVGCCVGSGPIAAATHLRCAARARRHIATAKRIPDRTSLRVVLAATRACTREASTAAVSTRQNRRRGGTAADDSAATVRARGGAAFSSAIAPDGAGRPAHRDVFCSADAATGGARQ